MKKYSVLFISCSVLTLFSLALSSCKDDPEPVKYNLTFSQTALTAVESDASIEIEIKLDKPAPVDITVDFELSGSAYDNIRAEASEDEFADFEVDGDYGNITIKKGESSAIIKLIPYSDADLEDSNFATLPLDPETIEVKFKSVDNADVLFVATDKSTVTLTQEDGIVVSLEWPESSTADGFVDMDLFVRIGATTSDWDGILTGSAYRSFEKTEYVFIPKTFIGTYFGLDYTNTTFGLSYTYYDGTRDNLAFTATFIDVIDNVIEPVANRQSFPGNYTAVNKNKWVYTENATPNGLPTEIAQTFRNVGGSFVEISEITTPVSSSRVVSGSQNEFMNQLQTKYKRTFLSTQKVLPKKYKRQL